MSSVKKVSFYSLQTGILSFPYQSQSLSNTFFAKATPGAFSMSFRHTEAINLSDPVALFGERNLIESYPCQKMLVNYLHFFYLES